MDNGEWDKLEKSGQLQEFGHTLLYVNDRDWIAARCWQSADGKGRVRYPMVAATLCPNLPLYWVIREAVPSMKAFEDQCSATSSADDVQRLYRSTENALRQVLPAEPLAPESTNKPDVFLYIADRPEMGKDRLGLLRLLYHMEREMPSNRGTKPMMPRSTSARPFSLRVPPCAETSMAAADLWIRFLCQHADVPAASILACIPDHGQWLDLMVGIPGPSQLYAMRATADVIPFTTDVPYTLDPGFVRRVDDFLEIHRTQRRAMLAEYAWP